MIIAESLVARAQLLGSSPLYPSQSVDGHISDSDSLIIKQISRSLCGGDPADTKSPSAQRRHPLHPPDPSHLARRLWGCIQPTIALSNKSADLIVAATVRRITQQRAQSWAEVSGNAWWIFEVLI